MPLISARVRVHFGPSDAPFYMLAGTRVRAEMVWLATSI